MNSFYLVSINPCAIRGLEFPWLLMVFLGVYASITLNEVSHKSTQISKTWVPGITANNEMIDAVSAYKIALYRHVISLDKANMNKYEEDLKKTDKLMKSAIQHYSDLAKNAEYPSEADRQSYLATIPIIEAGWNSVYKDTDNIVKLSHDKKEQEALAVMAKNAPTLLKLENETLRKMLEFNVNTVHNLSLEADEVYAKATAILTSIIIVSILIGIGIMFFLIRNIMASVNELMRIFDEVSTGNLADRATIKSQDELGVLVVSYNNLLDGMADLIHRIQGTADQVAAASEELTANAEQSANVTQQIAGSITQVSDLSSDAVNAVNNATEVIENISAGIEESAATVSLAAEGTKSAVTTAQRGRETIDGAVTQMHNIETAVNHSADVVTKLGERSKEIGQIVDTISGIAGQTNLLALNAAIEAARAGEQGKGFAVVAEEVRKLAEQSQEAAKQIGDLISGIQVDTSEAVVAMNEGTKEVKTGADAVNKAGVAFGEILKMISEVNHNAVEVSKTMEELARGTEQIVGSVQEIEASSKNVANEAQTVSAATEEQSSAMQEIASGSRGLANLAQQLQQATSQFTV